MGQQRGRCPGDCGAEGPIKLVAIHMRSCELYAQRLAADPQLMFVDLEGVYRAAHASDVPAAGRRGRRSKSTDSPADGDVVSPGAVAVEYWEWDPTLLETVQQLQTC